jgi:hypothetical protein
MENHNSIPLSKEEYKRLVNLLYLGDFIKNMEYIPESYEDLISKPDHQLLQKVFSAADKFDSQDLFERPDPDLPLILKKADFLLEKHFEI